MLTIEDALTYLGIDYPDAVIKKNVTRALATARAACPFLSFQRKC